METKAEYGLTVRQDDYLSPAATLKDALIRYQTMKEFVAGVLKPKVDFGTIPGASDKPSLLKPGAEKLASFFGLRPVFVTVEKINDWTGSEHSGEPFFHFQYKCQLYRNGEVIGEGCGSCNSWESKYRYRNQNRACPKCGKDTIIKGREEYGGGWICHAKKGGCGAKFKDNDPAITNQATGKIKNPDVFDQVNTIDKMAQKRALIASVLIATNASDYFTQDIEDYYEGEFVEQPHEVTEPVPAPAPAPVHDETPVLQGESSDYTGVCTEDGIPYSELKMPDLTVRFNSLSKSRAKDPAAFTDESQRKLDAAKFYINQARA